MDWVDSPAVGTIEGVVNTKYPVTLAIPPESVELANDWPVVIPLAVGSVVIEDAALFTTTVTLPIAVV